MRSLSILVVDDDVDLARGMANFLRLEGNLVELAFDGEEAEAIDQLRAMSVSGCLVKPFEPSELLRAIDAMVAEPA